MCSRHPVMTQGNTVTEPLECGKCIFHKDLVGSSFHMTVAHSLELGQIYIKGLGLIAVSSLHLIYHHLPEVRRTK